MPRNRKKQKPVLKPTTPMEGQKTFRKDESNTEPFSKQAQTQFVVRKPSVGSSDDNLPLEHKTVLTVMRKLITPAIKKYVVTGEVKPTGYPVGDVVMQGTLRHHVDQALQHVLTSGQHHAAGDHATAYSFLRRATDTLSHVGRLIEGHHGKRIDWGGNHPAWSMGGAMDSYAKNYLTADQQRMLKGEDDRGPGTE